MPQTIVYMDNEENEKVTEFAKIWEHSKADTIKRMIREYEKK